MEFEDDEVIVGTTSDYCKGDSGFFLVPAHAEGNNERCFVVVSSTRDIGVLE